VIDEMVSTFEDSLKVGSFGVQVSTSEDGFGLVENYGNVFPKVEFVGYNFVGSFELLSQYERLFVWAVLVLRMKPKIMMVENNTLV
jgi:hypothetical protein